MFLIMFIVNITRFTMRTKDITVKIILLQIQYSNERLSRRKIEKGFMKCDMKYLLGKVFYIRELVTSSCKFPWFKNGNIYSYC